MARKQQKPKVRKTNNKFRATRKDIISSIKLQKEIYRARFEFTGAVTDDLQRICKTNLTADIMQIIVNMPLDWVFDCVAVCDGYEKGDLEVFRNRTFNSLDQEVKDMQKAVQNRSNVNHLQRVSWFARVLKPGEEL